MIDAVFTDACETIALLLKFTTIEPVPAVTFKLLKVNVPPTWVIEVVPPKVNPVDVVLATTVLDVVF